MDSTQSEQAANSPVVGCFADSLTGSCDLASRLWQEGLKSTILRDLNTPFSDNVQVVILPCHRYDPEEMLEEFRGFYAGLRKLGTQCVTLHLRPTEESLSRMIPFLDRFMAEYHLPYLTLSPAAPKHGITVDGGNLESNGVRIDLLALFRTYSAAPCFVLPHNLLGSRVTRREQFLVEKSWRHPRFFLLPDHEELEDTERILESFPDTAFWVGGTPLLRTVAVAQCGSSVPPHAVTHPGRCLILAGSLARSTVQHIDDYLGSGAPAYQMDSQLLAGGGQSVDALFSLIRGASPRNVLLHSSNLFSGISKEDQDKNLVRRAEEAMGQIARRAVADGIPNLIVLGESTCRAVVRALELSSLEPDTPLLTDFTSFRSPEWPASRLLLLPGDRRAVPLTQLIRRMTTQETLQ